jgi:hypothetical protein
MDRIDNLRSTTCLRKTLSIAPQLLPTWRTLVTHMRDPVELEVFKNLCHSIAEEGSLSAPLLSQYQRAPRLLLRRLRSRMPGYRHGRSHAGAPGLHAHVGCRGCGTVRSRPRRQSSCSTIPSRRHPPSRYHAGHAGVYLSIKQNPVWLGQTKPLNRGARRPRTVLCDWLSPASPCALG